MTGLYEILTEKKWMVDPDFIHGIRQAFDKNLDMHSAFVKPKKTCGLVSAIAEDGSIYYPEEYWISENGQQVRECYGSNKEETNIPFVSVLTITGLVTRYGFDGFCGSINNRNWMMCAANNPHCCGHVFIIDTPGGSSSIKSDYQQAIEYAHEKGQPVIALIDGTCASAGMYIASFCDEVYYMHPKNQIGSIGVMAAFYTEADGSTNKCTNATYHELYDPESYDKNRSHREIANNGDAKELIKDLAELGKEFRANIKKAFPNATEEHLHGQLFYAEDVNGILVDNQSTLTGVIQHTFDLFYGKVAPIKREAVATTHQATPKAKVEGDETNTKTLIYMKSYPFINAACGLQESEIAMTEEGAFINAPLLDSLEACLKENKQFMSDAEEHATAAKQSLADLKTKFDELSLQCAASEKAKANAEQALAEANEAHTQQVGALIASHTEALAKKDADINTLTAEKDKAEAELNEAIEALATANQTLTDKNAQIASLTNEPGEEQNMGKAPSDNGEGLKVQKLREFDPSMYRTNTERREAFERFKRGEA